MAVWPGLARESAGAPRESRERGVIAQIAARALGTQWHFLMSTMMFCFCNML